MAIYTGDQQQIQGVVINGVLANANATVVDSLAVTGGAADYVCSTVWTQVYNGQTISLYPGVPELLTPDQVSQLLAAGAPIVAA